MWQVSSSSCLRGCQRYCTAVPAHVSHLQLCKLCLILRYAQSPSFLKLALAVLLHRTAACTGNPASSNTFLSKALLPALTSGCNGEDREVESSGALMETCSKGSWTCSSANNIMCVERTSGAPNACH